MGAWWECALCPSRNDGYGSRMEAQRAQHLHYMQVHHGRSETETAASNA